MSRTARESLDLTLYLVIGPADTGGRDLVEVVRQAVAGGVTLVQLRDKQAPLELLVETGRALKAALAPCGVPLVINDSIEAALATPADGIHLGQDDLATAAARAALGRWAIIGTSAGDLEEAANVDPAVVDYVGIGPAYATGSKADAGAPIGPEGLRRLRAALDLPLVAIGGIDQSRVAEVMACDVEGVAVVSAIADAADPRAAARGLLQAIRGAEGGDADGIASG